MELRCTNCGALLARPPPPATTVRCHFCGAEQALPALYAPHHPPTPGRPPPFAPDPHAPSPQTAAAVKTVAAASGAASVLVTILIVFVTLGGAVIGLVGAFRPRAMAGLTTLGAFDPAKLATLSLKATPERMAAVTGVKADHDLSMRVPLSGGAFDALLLTWDKLDTTHVKSFSLYTSTPIPNESDVRKKLKVLLGRRFEKGEDFRWGKVYFSFSSKTVIAHSDPDFSDAKRGPDDPHWADRLDALWDVTRNAVFGLNVAVSDAARRDWLGGGYPLSALASLDLETDVDGATAMMEKAFPGVSERVIAGLTFEVPLDHPWFGAATFDWPNEKAGRLRTVRIQAPPGMQYLPNQADVEKCVEATYGPGKITSEDHLKGTHMKWFKLPEGELRVDQYSVDVEVTSMMASGIPRSQWKTMGFTPPMGQTAWSKVIATLDACGKR